jgi:hypothetical protein
VQSTPVCNLLPAVLDPAFIAAHVQAVVGGTASSGVIICCLRIITKAALPPTRAGLRSSTALYFALSGLLSLACFVVYHSVLPRLEVVKYYKQKRQDGEQCVGRCAPNVYVVRKRCRAGGSGL